MTIKIITELCNEDELPFYTVGVKQDDMFVPVWDFTRDDQAAAFAENLRDMFLALKIEVTL